MPNGDYSLSRDDWQRIMAFFDERSAILLEFAAAHNLAVDKYYHQAPSWTFRFRNPKGGYGCVEVRRMSKSAARVNISWFVDEYENFTQYFKQEEGRELTLATIDLRKALDEGLKKLVAWNKEDLAPRDAKNPWANYSKEEWTKIWSLDRYPPLKP